MSSLHFPASKATAYAELCVREGLTSEESLRLVTDSDLASLVPEIGYRRALQHHVGSATTDTTPRESSGNEKARETPLRQLDDDARMRVHRPDQPQLLVGPPDVFLSLRFDEARDQALEVKTQLAAHGISAFLCDVPPGHDINEHITDAITACKLVVVFGTRTYGRKTTSFSTYQELRYIMDCQELGVKEMFLIRMSESYDESTAQFHLPRSVSYEDGMNGITSGLVNKIVAAVRRLSQAQS